MTEKHVINAMCKSLRASGLRQKESHAILNLIQKWIRSNGMEWTNSRLKELHQWYISYIADDLQIPAWWKHDKHGLPKGPFKQVFQLRNHQRALAILSIHTAMISEELLDSQLKKLEKGLEGNGNTGLSGLDALKDYYRRNAFHGNLPCGILRKKKLQYFPPEVPNFSILTGDSIPHGKTTTAMSDTTSVADMVEAYISSWCSIPFCTYEYMYLTRNEQQLPEIFDSVKDFLEEERQMGFSFSEALSRGSNNKLQLNGWLMEGDVAGRLSPLEQESLKIRWIANPNRVSQHYLAENPSKQWYSDLRTLPSDYTFNQKGAIEWCQKQIKDGLTLHSSDLTSATDLLSRQSCIALVEYFYHGITLPDLTFKEDLSFEDVDEIRKHTHPDSPDRGLWLYSMAIRHFDRMSSAGWYFTHENKTVSWKQGQPLGTKPSFALLGLTNNALGYLAVECRNSVAYQIESLGKPVPSWASKLDRSSSFVVVGDDICMRDEIKGYYENLIHCLGGEINPSKCVTSNRLAEIAGWVVEKNQSSIKRVKAKNPSDNNFIELYDRLGPQSRSLFLPRQKANIDEFKFIPGYSDMVPGPYAKNSYGAKLTDRYYWYLDQVKPHFDKDQLQPDFNLYRADSFRLYILETLASSPEIKEKHSPEYEEYLDLSADKPNTIRKRKKTFDRKHFDQSGLDLRRLLPRSLISDFQSESPSKTKKSGDPRLVQGKTLNTKLDEIRTDPNFTPFSSLKAQSTGSSASNSEERIDDPAPNTRRNHKDRDWDYGY